MTHLTDKEIIKALESEIHLAEYVDSNYCSNIDLSLIKSNLDLINRQQAEIEQLKIENKSLRGAANSYKSHFNESKAEAVREFAERLKDDAYIDDCYCCDIVLVDDIDYLLKEMAGETE